MRIIAGSLKGRNINLPKDYKARPTTDFAREGLFNMLCNERDLDGLSLLDLFGGTGAISCEFLSRGGASSTCVEMLPENASFIRRSAASLGLGSSLKVVHHNVFDFLKICTVSYDIVFADPPYAIDGLADIPAKILDAGVVKEGGLFIMEHPEGFDFSANEKFVKTRKYGNVHFSIFAV